MINAARLAIFCCAPTLGPESNEGVLAGIWKPHSEVLADWAAGLAILAGTKGLTRDSPCSPRGAAVVAAVLAEKLEAARRRDC
jgi:hypothetical protein